MHLLGPCPSAHLRTSIKCRHAHNYYYDYGNTEHSVVAIQDPTQIKLLHHNVPGKRPCTTFQGATVAASMQTYGIFILGKRPCGPKLSYVQVPMGA